MTERSFTYGALLVLSLLFIVCMGAMSVWIFSERRNGVEWQEQAKRQQAIAETALADRRALNSLQSDVIRQRAVMEGLSAEMRSELARLRTELENQRANPPQPVFDNLQPRILVQNLKGRAWGPEQATGEPDTPQAGDFQTAWASRTQDDQPEWLLLEYEKAVKITKVKVHESYNPGALNKVSVFDDAGKEIEVWRGNDPTPVGANMGVSTIALPIPQTSKRVKIYLDSQRVPGWNEIDAVGIDDDEGKTHWAVGATASSTFAEQDVAPIPAKNTVPDQF